MQNRFPYNKNMPRVMCWVIHTCLQKGAMTGSQGTTGLKGQDAICNACGIGRKESKTLNQQFKINLKNTTVLQSTKKSLFNLGIQRASTRWHKWLVWITRWSGSDVSCVYSDPFSVAPLVVVDIWSRWHPLFQKCFVYF